MRVSRRMASLALLALLLPRANYAHAGNWSSLSIETGEVTGFDGKRAQMLFVTARKSL